MRNIFILCLLFYAERSFGQAELFEPGLITNGQEFGMAVSPDGTNLLFVRAYGGRDTLRIFQSKRIDGKWLEPQPAFFSVEGANQIDPSYSPDGTTILINTMKLERKDYDVFAIRKTPSGWAELENLSEAINSESHEFYATMSGNKNIYFTRRTKSNDIYVSHWVKGQYQNAVALGNKINTDESESNPYIAPDETFIIFLSDRPGGHGGADLYVSFNKQGNWSYPINLGTKINSSLSEFCPSMDLKSERFVFARTQIENGKRVENIYSIPFKNLRINDLKKLARWTK